MPEKLSQDGRGEPSLRVADSVSESGISGSVKVFAGKVKVTIRAESEKGFDKAKLQNGVLEPLREADLIE